MEGGAFVLSDDWVITCFCVSECVCVCVSV